MKVNIAAFLERSSVNGPGTRAVIWVQGCPIRCRGCFNTEFWPFEDRVRVEVDDIADRILDIGGISGVTFSGGEPFAQAAALAELGAILQEHGLTVLTFTGFTPESLMRTDRPSWRRLLEVTDLLVAGPFIPELSISHPLLGSSNQRLIPLSGRIDLQSVLAGGACKSLEYSIAPDGSITITGFPDAGMLLGSAE